MSLLDAMACVVFFAVNLAVLRDFITPPEDMRIRAVHERVGFAASTIVMTDVLAIVLLTRPGRPGRFRGFVGGFIVAGAFAVIAHGVCFLIFPEAIINAYLRPVPRMFRLGEAYGLSGHYVSRRDGTIYFRSYPVVAVAISCWQLIAAVLGGAIAQRALGPRRQGNAF